MHDAGSGEHVLWACALPEAALSAAKPFICRYIPCTTAARDTLGTQRVGVSTTPACMQKDVSIYRGVQLMYV